MCKVYFREIVRDTFAFVDCTLCPLLPNLANERCMQAVIDCLRKGVSKIAFERRILYWLVPPKSLVAYISWISKQKVCSNCMKILSNPVLALNAEKLECSCDSKAILKEAKEKIWKAFGKGRASHVFSGIKLLPQPLFARVFFLDRPSRCEVEESYEVDGGKVSILKVEGRPDFLYFLDPIELHLSYEQLEELEKLREWVLGLEVEEVEEEVGKKVKDEMVKKVLLRYTIGYGAIEQLLSDVKLQDVYIDSPPEASPVHVYHRDYEECVTNIVITSEEAERLASRLRLLSGRPFDQSCPVIHADLPRYRTRVCGIMEPLTYKGTGFAFRKHAIEPWTLPKFIANRMLNAQAAGLLSFLVHNFCSILVSGPRGSGKTSLLSSLLFEIPSKYRMLIIEDTPELPVAELRKLGYKVQHLRVKPWIGEEGGFELSAEQAIRTALRLGESVLIVGEVRGTEAKTLFEAMRIGAAGNVVMGTVHGADCYAVFDRLTNDLGVPPSSFKACDVIVSCQAVKGRGLMRKRRVVEIVEVGKRWKRDPREERGFRQLMSYDAKRDELKLKEIDKSELLKRIARNRGMSMREVLGEINRRTKLYSLLVKLAKKDASWLESKKLKQAHLYLLEGLSIREIENKLIQSK